MSSVIEAGPNMFQSFGVPLFAERESDYSPQRKPLSSPLMKLISGFLIVQEEASNDVTTFLNLRFITA